MPNLSLLFARRYLFSKKSSSVINIISGVSSFAVAIPVAAMVILLSVFNGFEGLIKSMYLNFDPDIIITPLKGKVFDTGIVPYYELKSIEGIEEASYILDENALLEYRGKQHIGVMRGVDSLYNKVIPIDTIIIDGKYSLKLSDMDEAVVGEGVAYTLGINTTLYDPIKIYTPRRGKISPLLPYSFYNQADIYPSGIFALESEVDNKYTIVPLEFAQRLLDYEGRASNIAIKIKNGEESEKVQKAIIAKFGNDFKILTRYQQKEDFSRIMMYEKWGIYFIILLVMVVASFSLIGSLAMLIIDKRKDMQTLVNMGGDTALVRKIFVSEGMLIYCIGAVIGMILGLLIAWAQQTFKLVGIPAETFLIDAYPVEIKFTDMFWIIVTFVAMGYIISKFTVLAMIPKKGINT